MSRDLLVYLLLFLPSSDTFESIYGVFCTVFILKSVCVPMMKTYMRHMTDFYAQVIIL